MPRQPIVLAIDAPIPPDALAQVRRLSKRLEVIDKLTPEVMPRVNIVFTSDGEFDPKLAPDLRFIQGNTAAINHLMRKPLAAAGVPFANVAGAYTPAVAEFAFALLLMLTRRLEECYTYQMNRYFPVEQAEYPPMEGLNLHGKTMGIVGYGSIGRHIARIADAMGMEVLACKRSPAERRDGSYSLPNTGDPRGRIPARWFGVGRLKKMLALSRVAVIMVPLTEATRGLIGPAELDALPEGAYLINLGRGGVVDERAVAERLKSGRLAGAGLDVFVNEPLEPDSPLWDAPNCIIAPHIASYTKEQHPLAAAVLIENLRRFLAGKPLVNLVDLKAGY